MSILKQILCFEENKDNFSKKEQEEIKKGLIKSCNKIIKKATTSFVEAIDRING